MASNVSRSADDAFGKVFGVRHFDNEPHVAARLERNAPATRFQKCRVKPRGGLRLIARAAHRIE
jgi:hypothetical protein